MIEMGGIKFYEENAIRKSSILYNLIDDSKKETGSNLYFENIVDLKLRSRMNIPFNLRFRDSQD